MPFPKVDQLSTILNGWKNVMIVDPEVEILAQERGQACLQCPYKKAITCGMCGCPLKAKLRAVDATCPDNRWLQ